MGAGRRAGCRSSVRATIPAGTNTNQVTLTGLSFSSGTAGFNVYRGLNPIELLLIAANVAVATTLYGCGRDAASCRVRRMRITITRIFTGGWNCSRRSGADIVSATTIGNSTLGMLANDFAGAVVRITRGTGATQERAVVRIRRRR